MSTSSPPPPPQRIDLAEDTTTSFTSWEPESISSDPPEDQSVPIPDYPRLPTDGQEEPALPIPNSPELPTDGQESPILGQQQPLTSSRAKGEAPIPAQAESSQVGESSIQPTTQEARQRIPGTKRTRTPGPRKGKSLKHTSYAPGPAYFKSRRVKKEDIDRSWKNEKDPREIWGTILPLIGIFIGLVLSALLIWLGLKERPNYRYCTVLDEKFDTWNDEVWTKEVEVGGYGNGQFEMTTDTEENVFIENGALYIRPTLQDPKYLTQNYTLDLRNAGCTGTLLTQCYIQTNTTNGTIINPVKSGRIHTKRGASIKYGRVEVEAQLPRGDWMWPAIWMLPVNSTYGPWPASGEIDIAESRGNDFRHPQGGNNIVSSTLHFGPNGRHDGWWRNNVKQDSLHETFADRPHVFGVEWTEKYIYTYIDNRLMQIMYTPFKEGMWSWGKFPLNDHDGSRLVNPWEDTGRKNTPFDQDFYLVLNVAVGSTNGWFKDGLGNKPWVDRDHGAMKEFWEARDQWYPTWKKKGFMKVNWVKMWQQEGYNGCYEK